MKPPRILACVAVLVLGVSIPAAEPRIDPDLFLAHIKYLAGERLNGRGNGTPELGAAARYIAEEFRARGLAPAAGNGKYCQQFSVTLNPRRGIANRLRWSDGVQTHELSPDTDFQPLSFSSTTRVSAGVVFAGYGITAREYGYDDYAGIDVHGKVVIVLRHEPREFDAKGPFAGRAYTIHSQLPWKAATAHAHGAAAMLYVNDIASHSGESDEFEPFSRTVGSGNEGIALVQVKAAAVDRLLAAAGKNLKGLAAAMDKGPHPQSFVLPDALRVELETEVHGEPRAVCNVAGYLEGSTAEYIVFGAHYDHIGTGEQFSMEPSAAGKTHYGADDNASGVAGIIELAHVLATRPKHRRGYLFLAFAGEELGLLGSSYWVRHPGIPLDKAVAMIDLDMIGRIRGRHIQIGGEPSAKMRKLLNTLSVRNKLEPEYAEPPGYSASDHSAFAARPMPALFFFSGLHPDYHTPRDTWDKINAAGSADLLRLVMELGEHLADAARPGEVD
ncbi:MAG: M28 family peptidase [Bryobacteraceae bacterium]